MEELSLRFPGKPFAYALGDVRQMKRTPTSGIEMPGSFW